MTRRVRLAATAGRVATAAFLLSAVVGVAIAAWYAISPRATLDDMARAARRRDGVGLTAMMDLPALRRDMRGHAAEILRREHGGSRVRMDYDAVADILAGTAIDRAFSPEGAQRQLDRQSDVSVEAAHLHLDDVSLDAFHATVLGPRRFALTFAREAFSWRLVSIRYVPTRPAIIV